MRLVTKGAVFMSIAVMVLQMMSSVALADDGDDVVDTLKGISADKSDEVDIRLEALRVLREMRVADSPLFAAIAGDKSDENFLRMESLDNLSPSGPSDATVRGILGTVILDKTDNKSTRGIAMSVAEKLGLDSCGLREELWAVCTDADDEASVRYVAICVLSKDPGPGGVQNLVDILENPEEEEGVRMGVLTSLEGSRDAVFVNALKGLISTKVPADEEDSIWPKCHPFGAHPVVLRLRAIAALPKYLDDDGVVGAVKAVAVDTTEEEFVRLAAINRLGNYLVQASATEALAAAANDTNNSIRLRINALTGIGNEKTPVAYSLLCACAADMGAPTELRKRAVALLSKRLCRQRRGVHAHSLDTWEDCSEANVVLLGLAREHDADIKLRIMAVSAMHWTTDTAALEGLRELAGDESIADKLRIAAINALSLDGGSVIALDIIADGEGESQEVKDAAKYALEKIDENS